MKDPYSGPPIRAGVYRHYKGGLYLFLGIGQHTETEELLAVYVSLTGANELLPGPRLRCRPLEEWLGTVPAPDASGRQVARFAFWDSSECGVSGMSGIRE